MNEEQLKSAVRWFISTFGGMIAGWGAAKGWLTADQIMAVFNSQAFLGVALGAAGLIWSIVSKTRFGVLLTTAKVVPDAKIVIPDQQLADQLPPAVKGPADAVVVPK